MDKELFKESMNLIMTKTYKPEEYKKLPHGIYKIYWKSGGSSLASIGYDRFGKKWMAPCNWINMDKTYIEDRIEEILKFKLIKESKN